MTNRSRRILVVEDMVLIAQAICDEITSWGYTVVGPVPRLQPALQMASAEALDGALLDVNLGGDLCFPIAATLNARGIPFIFVTGYSATMMPTEYQSAPRVAKPVDSRELAQLMDRHFQATGPTQ